MRGPWAALAACCLAFFWAQSARAIVYSAMPALSAELGLGPTTVGLVTGAMYAAYSIAMWVSGLLPFSRRATVVGGLLLGALTNVALAWSGTVTALLLIAAVGGLGLGVYLPRGTAVIVEAFPAERRARAMGWHEVAAGAGLMVAPLCMGALLLVTSWRVAITLWSTVGLVAAAAVWAWVPEAPGPRRTATAAPLPLDARVPALACMGGACFAVMSGFFTMLPTLMAQGFGATPAGAAAFAGWTRASGLGAALAGGWVADWVGHTRSIAGWHSLAALAIVGLWFLDAGTPFAALLMVMTMAASAAATAYYAVLGEAYRPAERERIYGLIQASASLLGSTLTPVLLGVVLDRVSARATLVTLTAFPLVGLAGLGLYRRTARRLRREHPA